MKPHFHLRARLVALLAFLTFALSLGQALAYDRIFNLTLTNGLNVPVTWTIHPGSCYEGTGVLYPGGLVHGPVAPGASVTLTMARVQGHGCDGEQGKFQIESSFTYPDIPEGSRGWHWQAFDFSNDGDLRFTYYPNGYMFTMDHVITGNRKDYFCTMKDISHRLSGPIDERLTMPRNQVARNFGKWDGGSEDGGGIHINHLTFRKNGHQGMTYSECFAHPMFHAQHVVRLPNKNGRAYFAVTNSWAEYNAYGAEGRPRGNLGVYRADSLNPVTDLVIDNPGADGDLIWERQYGWNTDQAVPYNPDGSWNHPCKMDVCGGVMIVSMLDWDAGACYDGHGEADQNSVLFYDVRDPENPRFWGRMTKTQLGLPGNTKIENANLAQVGSWWVLNVEWKWWYTKKVSPIISDWTFGGSLAGPSVGAMQGQHFNSYERYTLPGETAPSGTITPGLERIMFGNGEGRDQDNGNHVAGDEFLSFQQVWFDMAGSITLAPKALGSETWTQGPQQYRTGPNLWTIYQLPGIPSSELATHMKDYDACGVSVRNGMPVFYSPLVYYNDDIDPEDESIDHIWQIFHPDNFALQTPPEPRVVSHNDDNSAGSLREAIDHGGTITFVDGPNPWSGVELEGGPLMVYLNNVAIDASTKPSGLTLYGVPDSYGKIAPLIQVLPGLSFSMKNVRSENDPLAAALGTTQLACATGGHAIWNAQNVVVRPGATLAARSGSITHNQESYLHSAVEGPGTLTFWWGVSSQAGADFLRFRLDGAEQAAAPAISGAGTWAQKTISIPAGHHQLRWTYSKDGSTNTGYDAGFVSEVVYTPSPPVLAAPLAINATQGVWTRGNYITTTSGSPTSFTASTLPTGLYFDPASGHIWGSPSVSGTFNVTVTAINAGGTSAPGTMTITIAPTATTLTQALDLPVHSVPIEHWNTIPSGDFSIAAPFFGQTSVTHDGTDAAQSKSIANGQASDIVTYYYGPGTLSFWWKVSSRVNRDYLRLQAEGVNVPGISGNVDWQFVSVSLSAGVTAVRWVYSKDAAFGSSGSDAGWVDEVKFVPSLAQALDTPPITWTPSGNANWFGQMTTSVDGLAPVPSVYTQRDAAQSGDISDSQSSSMETTVTGPATLTFWWKVSSEATYDFLRFYLDNVQQPEAVQISGEVDWTQKTIPVPAGTHTLKWTYSKDESISRGADAAWVDRVVLSPPHTITSALTASASQDYTFSYAITARNSATNFDATGLPPGLTINTLTGVISGLPTAPGVFNVGLQASGHQGLAANPISSWWGSSTATLVLTVAPSTFSIETALDTSGLTWTTSSPGAWYGQPATSQDGVDAMRSSGIADGQSAALETTITGPGVLSFWWKVSCEEYVGWLTFAMDDAPVDDIPPISGEVGWVRKFVVVPPGDHKFTWAYRKQGINDVGADAGWVDQVQFTSSLVTRLADSGAGSLRQVLQNLIALSAGTTTVNFHDSLNGGTITLGGTEIVLPSVFIDGSSLSNGITIHGAGLSRVFRVTGPSSVAMKGITISGGAADGGGGISNLGTLTLDQVRVTGNTAATGKGGGIGNLGTLTITDSTISGNSAPSEGGGGIHNEGTLVVSGSTFTGNTTSGASGGAISTWSYSNPTSTTVTNSTIAGNTALVGGGMVSLYDSVVNVIYCTVANNHSEWRGGGLAHETGTLHLENCIVAGNTTGISDADIRKFSGTITGAGANLIGSNSSVTTEFPAGPLVGTSASPVLANLATLGDYGGPTQTMPPLPGSPAFNTAISGVTPSDVSSFEWPYATDQRGMTRETVDSDLGAVEIVQIVGVASALDTGAYTLRKAIEKADFNSTIKFNPALGGQTITLGGVQLLIDKNVTIDGSDVPGGISVSGNNASRVMQIGSQKSVVVKGLSLIDGTADYGGAIRNNGTLLLKDSEVSGSTASNQGGGIYNYFGALTLENVTLAGNISNGLGGGIWSAGGSLSLTSSTVQGNRAAHHAGVVNENGAASLIHNTISGNIAGNGSGDGGGFSYLYFGSASLTFANNIVAGNLGNVGPDIYNNDTFTPTGANFIGKNHTVTAQFPAGPLAGTSASPLSAKLAPLANYGGRTKSMPPLPGSPVIETAMLLANTPPTDQRGNPRPAGPLPDIGAVEAGPFPLGSLADTDADGIPDVLEGLGGPYPQFTVGVNDSGRDSDGDGSTDAQEIANMTNLNDGNDRLKPLAFGTAVGFDPVTNPLFNVSFTTFPGVQYQLETSADLQSFPPLAGSTFTATGYIRSVQIMLPPNHRFVRMKRL